MVKQWRAGSEKGPHTNRPEEGSGSTNNHNDSLTSNIQIKACYTCSIRDEMGVAGYTLKATSIPSKIPNLKKVGSAV